MSKQKSCFLPWIKLIYHSHQTNFCKLPKLSETIRAMKYNKQNFLVEESQETKLYTQVTIGNKELVKYKYEYPQFQPIQKNILTPPSFTHLIHSLSSNSQARGT